MNYLCLAYYDEKAFANMPQSELQALERECAQHDAVLRDSGHLLAVASLAAPADSVSLRPNNGRTTVTDGPFAETREQIGAFFVIEARDLNEAIQVASKHPAALLGERLGWGIELRPVERYEPRQ